MLGLLNNVLGELMIGWIVGDGREGLVEFYLECMSDGQWYLGCCDEVQWLVVICLKKVWFCQSD